MSFRDDERAVTVQVGAILLLGVLVVLMSAYQVNVVPDQNGTIEFVHSQEALADVEDLRNALLTAASADSTRPVAVTLGTTYPTRTVFVNPPPPTGSLRTADAGTLALENARATDAEAGDFLDGTADVGYETTSIRYDPGYNVYGDAPATIYENTLVYNRFPNGENMTETDQSLIDGRRLNLVAVRGNLSESGLGTTVDPTAESAAARTVPVTGEGGNVTLRLPTDLPPTTWRDEILAGEFDGTGDPTNDRYVHAVRGGGPGTVEVEMEAAGETYELRTALVGVGTGATTPEAAYVVDVGGTDATVAAGSDVPLTVEVRDRYNNPVSGVEVSASATAGTVGNPPRTDEEGRTTATYDRSAAGTATVTFSIEDGTPDAETVAFRVDVVSGSGDGSGGDASALYGVRWNTSAMAARSGVSYAAANDTLYVNRSVTSDALPMLANVTDAADGDPVEGVDLDVATNDSAVADFSVGSAASNATGEVGLDAALANGTAKAYVASGGAGGDRLTLRAVSGPGDVGGGDASALGLRVDDLTDLNGNRPDFVASYDVGDANASFERVEVSFVAADGSPSTVKQAPAGETRGHLRYRPGNGTNGDFDVTLRPIHLDENGDEYVAERTTITDAADGATPAGRNDDLPQTGSPSVQSLSVADWSNGQNNRLDYRVDYRVTSDPDFGEVEVAWVNQDGSGPTSTEVRGSRSGNNVRYMASYGTDSPYRVGVLVYDGSGAVVDVEFVTDTADGTDP